MKNKNVKEFLKNDLNIKNYLSPYNYSNLFLIVQKF